MNPGDIVLIHIPQVGGGPPKLRPALLLTALPGPYQNLLLCGISAQLHHQQANWDELLQPGDADFRNSGLHRASLIRLSYLYAADMSEIRGMLGQIEPSRLQRMRTRLADHLRP